MVAISLYRGNLHKVPDVPRRWPPPIPKISLKDFRILLRRRNRALSRLHSSIYGVSVASKPNCISVSNNNGSVPDPDHTTDALGDSHGADYAWTKKSARSAQLPSQEELKEGVAGKKGEVNVSMEKMVEGEVSLKILVAKTDELLDEKNGDVAKNDGKTKVLVNTEVEACNKNDAAAEKERRIKEVKGKLENLKEKKYNLVQVLKQILSAEEQLKRQNNMQGTSGPPPLPLQMDATTDTGSVTRINTPRLGADGNSFGDMDGGEGDDVSNNNIHSRHFPRMSSTSPSSDSQQRKSASHVPLVHRTSLGVTGSPSPSRFAPAGQVHSSVSVSGTSYVASSPSPAASGGTSIFRDGRLPSPWN